MVPSDLHNSEPVPNSVWIIYDFSLPPHLCGQHSWLYSFRAPKCRLCRSESLTHRSSSPHSHPTQAKSLSLIQLPVSEWVSESCSVALCSHIDYNPWNSPGQNTRVDSLCVLHGIFPTQGSNPGLPHCGQILYQLSHKGSPAARGFPKCPAAFDIDSTNRGSKEVPVCGYSVSSLPYISLTLFGRNLLPKVHRHLDTEVNQVLRASYQGVKKKRMDMKELRRVRKAFCSALLG